MSKPVRFQLPKIDRDSLPDLLRPIGMFGSRADTTRRQASDADRASLEAYLYELHPGI